ncbi:MAG TPA: hypothetical protein VF034_06730 [Gemmatimonadaceae bacterium]
MIVGHVGVAAATRSAWQRASLPWLLVACVSPDLVDIAFALAGVCNPYGLYSHTVHAALLQGAVLGGAALLVTGSRTTAVASALMVLLHLPPDLITGHKIFWPGAPMVGLYLYQYPLLDFLVEAPIVIAGWWLLRRSRRAPRWATSALVLGVLLAGQGVLDLMSGKEGAKPSACSTPRQLP